MAHKIVGNYKADCQMEISVDSNGSNFLLLYGQHINGYWCCIPNWRIGCEMSDPSDTFYNREALERCGISKRNASDIAAAIKEAADKYLLKGRDSNGSAK